MQEIFINTGKYINYLSFTYSDIGKLVLFPKNMVRMSLYQTCKQVVNVGVEFAKLLLISKWCLINTRKNKAISSNCISLILL